MKLKKIDKLVMKAFLGPFFLLLGVVLFIFLLQYMIKNFQYFVGKDLGFFVFVELFFYFGLVLTPISLPLSVLLSSLMTFGGLGQHSELTAIKGAGISLLRILRPTAFFVGIIAFISLFFNNYIVTWANLEAYSLLYDIKQTKLTLDFKEGVFYNGIPGFSIKVGKKHPDGKTIEDVIIYDHKQRKGNTRVIMAESGVMEMINNKKFLALTLENGTLFIDQAKEKRTKKEEFFRTRFGVSQMVFDLSSFEQRETKKDLFKGHDMMKKLGTLLVEQDSLIIKHHQRILDLQHQVIQNLEYLKIPLEKTSRQKKLDSIKLSKPAIKIDSLSAPKYKKGIQSKFNKAKPNVLYGQIPTKKAFPLQQNLKTKRLQKVVDKPKIEQERKQNHHKILIYNNAISAVETANRSIVNKQKLLENLTKRMASKEVTIHRKIADSLAIFIMFLIGAPLGAIIKKGGLGVPVLISIAFFVLYYITSNTGIKLAKEEIISPIVGSWMSNFVLLIFGLFFLKQAKDDARLFDTDIYAVFFQKVKQLFVKPTER